MSKQTIEKLRRLLEIEKAKSANAERRYQEAIKHYSDASFEAVIAKVRIEQAMKILTGEADE